MNKYKHYAFRVEDPRVEIHVRIDVKPDEDPFEKDDTGKPHPNAILIYEGDDKDALLAAIEPWFEYYQKLDDERKANEQAATVVTKQQ